MQNFCAGFFITGTDTGIGKTVVTAGIAGILLQRGYKVGVMKPVQAGAMRLKGKWVSGDLEFVGAAIAKDTADADSFSCPYLLKKPVAPNLAAKLDKASIKISLIKREYARLASRNDFVALEGAGGLMVPLNERKFMADLVLALEIPLLIVARPNLGTINHTLLTIQAARQREIPVLGLIFNNSRKKTGQGEKESMAFIKRQSGVPVLGTLPFIPGLDVESLKPGRLKQRFKMNPAPLLKLGKPAKSGTRRTGKIKELDKSFVWHPFTQMKDWLREDPLIIEKGEGSYLIDTEGRRYLDGVSSIWVTTHGHRKKELNQGIKDQLNKIAHSTMLGLGNVPAAELAEKLTKIAPENLKKVFYSDCGSTAVEIALKMAYQYWLHRDGGKGQRKKFIYLSESYHGDTLGSMGVGGITLFHDLFRPLLFDSYKIANPYCYRCPMGRTYPSCKIACADEAAKVLQAHSSEIAALILEPMVQGAGGLIVFPRGYLKKIASLCRKAGVLLIADEVATGFGRTGRMFACEHEGIQPDILCTSKGITGGYLPLAATLTTEKIYSAFLGEYEEFKTFFHGHTYTGNPLGCAASLANIEIFRKENVLRKMQKKVLFLQKGLKKIKKLKHVGDIRQLGFMVGIELVRDKATREPFPLEEKIGIRVTQEARLRGAIIRPLGNVVVLMPHLSFSQKEIGSLLAITFESIQAVFKE